MSPCCPFPRRFSPGPHRVATDCLPPGTPTYRTLNVRSALLPLHTVYQSWALTRPLTLQFSSSTDVRTPPLTQPYFSIMPTHGHKAAGRGRGQAREIPDPQKTTEEAIQKPQDHPPSPPSPPPHLHPPRPTSSRATKPNPKYQYETSDNEGNVPVKGNSDILPLPLPTPGMVRQM